uniref:Uncharacterized protein n=1 Tax=Opuntia streptacantha TaxID=393608 RepID=A0A7C9DM50_OPUST
MSRVLDSVVLLDGFNVKSLELHHRLNVTFEGVELTKPCNLSPSFGLLSNLIELPVAVLVIEESRRSLWCLEPMESPLSMSPLSFPFLFTEVLLGGEGGPALKQVLPCPSAQGVANGEFEKVEWDVENNVVEPYYTSPSPATSFDVSKAPVGIYSNHSGNQLCNQESSEQQETRALNIRPAPGTSDKNEGLAHNTHLKVQSSHHFLVTVSQGSYAEFVREEVSLLHYPEENDSHQRQVTSKNNSSGKDFLQLPAVRNR